MLLITHAGVIRCILAHELELQPQTLFQLHIETGHISRIRIDGQRPPTLMFHNQRQLDAAQPG